MGRKAIPLPPPSKLPPIESAYVFTAIAGVLLLLALVQRRDHASEPRWLPAAGSEKHEYELWVLKYSVFWMGTFAVIIAFQLYEYFGATSYFVCCGGLALPLLLQPLLMRGPRGRCAPSLGAQHAARAQLWILIFGFIGNYWCAPPPPPPCKAARRARGQHARSLSHVIRVHARSPLARAVPSGHAGTRTTFTACCAPTTRCPRGG